MKNSLKDLTGRRFGKLSIAWAAGRGNRGQVYWLAFCDCGSFRTARKVEIRQGRIDRCVHEAHVDARTKHGYTTQFKVSPEYGSWSAMIQRCTNPKTRRWKRYGGRGIKVCERWMDFKNFIADMGPKPEPKRLYSIDRFPNNDGNYEPRNCRWATWKEQNRTARRSKDGRFEVWSEDAI